jgi:hypothetical protein
MRRRLGLRTRAGLAVVALAAATALTGAVSASATSGAISTTDNTAFGTGACLNGHGSPVINCNIYAAKPDVWFSGLPNSAALNAGDYFFAVVTPGEQNGGFLDGANGNLSDTTVGGTTGDLGSGDPVANRTFSIDGSGTVSYTGDGVSTPHNFFNNAIQLSPYDDTDNPGGVYILAVCPVGATDPKDCKYDAFKVKTATTPPASDLVVTKSATPSFTRTIPWDITKTACLDDNGTPSDPCVTKTNSTGSSTWDYTVSVTHGDPIDGGWKVTGTIHVANPNMFDVSGVNVTDAVDDGGNCAVDNGTDVTVPGLGFVDLTYTCTYDNQPDPPTGTNTATAKWDEGPNVHKSADGQASFDFGDAVPTIVDGTVNVTDPNAPDPPYTNGLLGQADYTQDNPIEFTYSKTFDADPAGTCTKHPNTASFATVEGTTVDKEFVPDQTGSADADVTQCVGADLTVEKGAAPAFTRTFTWHITKAVDKTTVRRSYPGTATFNYTVKASHDAAVDSGWQVTGTITVTNPNDFESVTYDLSDALDTGSNGTCSIDSPGGSSLTVAASDTKQSTYTCTFSAKPNPLSGTNTATATWDSSAASTPDGSATGTHSYAFGNPTTTTDECVNVSDSFKGVLAGSQCATATTAQTFTFTYSRIVYVDQFTCKSYDNTATFTTNDTGATGSAGQTVTVCPTVPGLTIGYWQNKNGQARISGGAYTTVNGVKVCNSGTYLRTFAPFQDLSSSATCAQTATYVYNVIKAATCGGSTCNAMLKAQMLATALNVFFGVTPGNMVIDLVHGCSMIDGSGGTATCNGSENWSSVFGGATSLTVSQMLTYAAGQSNVGGTTWYGQNKANQVKAKDAFDAINNGVALSA